MREVLVPAEAPPSSREPFAPNTAQQQTLGITARELEILTLVARGLSNREIATQLFVSENTVKTHCARAFDKLGAARRTQAVQRGKELGLCLTVKPARHPKARFPLHSCKIIRKDDDIRPRYTAS